MSDFALRVTDGLGHDLPAMTSDTQVLTDGFDLYIRLRRGVYAQVSRRGTRMGGIQWGFEPRPRWRPARRCCYEIAVDGLTCPKCGLYDIGYAETGVRSFCRDGYQKIG